METIKISNYNQIPNNFTGIILHTGYGNIEYYLNGNLHRLDGPAIVYDKEIYYRSNYDEYWINGIYFPEINNNEEFYKLTKHKQYVLLNNLKLIKNINQ